jgi:peptidoglycan/xylan/chitin deacetylase (PgdA/CDA1 family)
MEPRIATRPWQPVPAIRLSTWLHLLGAVSLAAQPESWPFVLAAVLANHLLLASAVLLPRSRLLGGNLVRLPAAAARRNEIALTFDDGPERSATPQVLDLLDRYGAKASFFVIGERASANPDLIREIVRRGHSVENHSQAHSHAFAFYGVSRLRRELSEAQGAISALTGRPPQFFRAPYGFRSPLLDPVLAGLGLRYVSWSRRGFDATQHDPDKVFGRLVADLGAGDILLMHDGVDGGTVRRAPTVVEVLPRLLDAIAARRLMPVSLPAAFKDGFQT